MSLRVAVLELPARFDQVAAALDDARRALEEGPCDLAVLPECALTGYVDARGDFDLTRFAELVGGPTTAAIAELARTSGAHLAAPLIERDAEGRCFNSCLVVAPSGEVLFHHQKKHPWYPERCWATAGVRPWSSFELGGLRVTVAICFDVRFVIRGMAEILETTDLLLFPSAWVDDDPNDARAPIFDRLIGRFGVTIANANWGPGVPRIRGQGGSRIVGSNSATWVGHGARRADAVVAAKPAREPI